MSSLSPSDQELKGKIQELVPQVDLETTGVKQFIKLLSKELGGDVMIPENPIPGVGKFAWIKDIDGNLVGLINSIKKN